MTTYNKANLKVFFETGDVPTGQNYADLIDSQINIAESSEQTMIGALNTPELISSRISAGNGNVIGTFSAGTINATATYSNLVSAAALYGFDIVATNSLSQYNGIVSAAGTSLATAASANFVINTIAGVTDGAATGVGIPTSRPGMVQYFMNNTAASANIWPVSGMQINALATGAAYGITAGSTVLVIHTSTKFFAK